MPWIGGAEGNSPSVLVKVYGTAPLNGPSGSGGQDGTIFKVTPGGTLTPLHTIFRITLPGGTFSTLHAFSNIPPIQDGCHPQVTLVQHTNGILYGDTNAGGSLGQGVFFSLNESLPPFVSLLPYSGKVAATIEFLGQGFTSTTTVSFSGTTASRTVVSGTFLTATVPSGAGTGLVTVTTSSGTLKSNKLFRVIPQITGSRPRPAQQELQ
jgi:hypothetical protein